MKRLIGGAVFAALTLTARCEDFALALLAGRGPHVAVTSGGLGKDISGLVDSYLEHRVIRG
jgi:hypothetical protein